MAGVSVRLRGTGDPEAPRLSQAPDVTRGIRGRRPAREKSCLELQKNRHRSPQSALASHGHDPSGRGGGIRLRPADCRPEADIRPHRKSRSSP
jgi:hypothetical protein